MPWAKKERRREDLPGERSAAFTSLSPLQQAGLVEALLESSHCLGSDCLFAGICVDLEVQKRLPGPTTMSNQWAADSLLVGQP